MYLRWIESKVTGKVIPHVFFPTQKKRLLLGTEVETLPYFCNVINLRIARTVTHVFGDIACCANNGFDERDTGDGVMGFVLSMVLVEVLQETFGDSMFMLAMFMPLVRGRLAVCLSSLL